MRVFVTAVLFLTAALCAAPASAQTPGRWLDSFAVPGAYPSSAGRTVRSLVTDGDGVLVGGTFQRIDGTEARNVARWTGSVWEPVGGGIAGFVSAVVRDPQGAIWVAGSFDTVTQPNGAVLNAAGLARWTGAAWEIPGRLADGMSGVGSATALLVEGGSVYVSGRFTDVIRPDGTRLGGSGVVRWTNGTWQSLGAQSASPLAAAPGGGVLFVGAAAGGTGSGPRAVVRFDGQTVTPVTSPLDGPAFPSALLASDGRITVGGFFSHVVQPDGSLLAAEKVAQWDGSAWSALSGGITSGSVEALASDGAGGVLVGGTFPTAQRADGSYLISPKLVRWDGAGWQPSNLAEYRFANDFDSGVYTLASRGAEALVGGTFQMTDGVGDDTRRASNLAVRSASGAFAPLSAWTGRDGSESEIVAPDGCGGIRVAAEAFESAGPRPGAVARRWDGASWLPVPEALQGATVRGPFSGQPGYGISTLSAEPGSCDAFVLGGYFEGIQTAGGAVESPNVVRFDGAEWQALGRGTDERVAVAVVSPGGRITVGGAFAEARQDDGTPVAAVGVAQWTPAEGWSRLGGGLRQAQPGTRPVVTALLAEPDGSVVVGGSFASVVDPDGTERPASSVARWTGTAWETFGGTRGLNAYPPPITAMVRRGVDLVIGGPFQTIVQPDGSTLDVPGLAAFDGTAWRALPSLRSLTSADLADLDVLDGRLVATAKDVWVLDGDVWAPLSTPSNSGDFAMRLAPVGRRLYVGGGFEMLGGVTSPTLAVFDLDGTIANEAPPTETRARRLAAFPNPARGATTLRFAADGPARLVLLDVLGRTVAVLLDGETGAGERTVRVDTSRLPAGVYVARLDAGGETTTARVTVVR